jgi:hypothetical protein
MRQGVARRDRESGIKRAAAYLALARGGAGGLRWSTAADVLEYSDGSTFAFAAEVLTFLEGFASERPLIAFTCLLHLLRLLRPRTETPPPAFARLREAFQKNGRDFRNAGVFAAQLCRDVPPAPDPPTAEDLWYWLVARQVGTHDPPEGGEIPPLALPAFEARVQRALEAYTFEDVAHWMSRGCGPVRTGGAPLARVIEKERPPSLEGVLGEVAQRERLSGAVPFVRQLVSALTLPPRWLAPPELPLGGYADVSTHGQLGQILPSQLAYDDLEFVRRLAQRELLFFRREDPHVRTREDLVVLLDQGVRTWGKVRLVLTAAVFALGRLAQRRGLPFRATLTSTGGELCDPLGMTREAFGGLLEASDLSANPGLALERVLAAPAEAGRDVVLLTHPRSLAEPDVAAAARTLRPGQRLFALAVADDGNVQWAEMRHGLAVSLSRFHMEPERAPPAPAPPPAGPGSAWRGDLEPVPYPFQLGVGAGTDLSLCFAFDHAGEWLLLATNKGMLYLTRTDGTHSEVLPRGRVDGQAVQHIGEILGVAGGFVVITPHPAPTALHYDLARRTCRAHRFPASAAAGKPGRWCYYRWAHTLVLQEDSTVRCLYLDPESRDILPGTQIISSFAEEDVSVSGRTFWRVLPPQDKPHSVGLDQARPRLSFDTTTGAVTLFGALPEWEAFMPLADGQPLLRGAALLDAVCQGRTLAALFRHAPGRACKLRLFRGPQGIPLAEFHQPATLCRFALSSDGRLLARQPRASQVEVRDVAAGGPPLCLTPRGRFHHNAVLELGKDWLTLQTDNTLHLVRWGSGRLQGSLGRGDLESFLRCELAAGGLGSRGTRATAGQVPAWLRDQCGSRFTAAAVERLTGAVDRFGEAALFRPDGGLVCMFFAFRQQIAAWMPDGTCWGPVTLLGRPASPEAAEKIGRALCEAANGGPGRPA